MSLPACGIDFGTSNSTVAIAGTGETRLVPLEAGRTTLPSAIFFKEKVGPLFGRQGIDAYLAGEEGRLLRGLKKILGTALMNDKTMIGGRPVAFTHILGTFVSHLKSQAEADAGQAIDSVVMGRPVHFHDDNDAADSAAQDTLESIARAAGFSQIDFLFEPIAAAFAHEEKIEREALSLVIDLGGGTSDFTVIKIAQAYMTKADRSDDILATSGVRVGGTTFDYRLSLKNFMPDLGLGTSYRDVFDKEKILTMPSGVYFDLSDWAMVHQAQTRKAIAETQDILRRSLSPEKLARLYAVQDHQLGHALLEQVEISKIALSHAQTHAATMDDLPDVSFLTQRDEFEGAIAADVARIHVSIQECLTRAQVTPDQIDLVILTGGSTELPVIDHMVRALFPHAAFSQGNKLDSVGLGLAYRAHTFFR